MRALCLALCVLLGVPSGATAVDDPHSAFDEFLADYVVERQGLNRVRYGAVTPADHAALERYIADLEGMRPSQMSEEERLAYYFNLYNAAIIDLVLDEYPIQSIRQVGGRLLPPRGPWKQEVVTVEGEALSFDDIEHGRVRANTDEPRVHYAFNCASVGCPDIRPRAWRAETLDEDLDAAARRYVASDRGVGIGEDGAVDASSIYRWFQEDFGGSEAGVLAHLAAYAQGEKRAAIEAADGIDDYRYDWSLNGAE